MPQNAYRTTPVIKSGILYSNDTFTGCVVGSDRWQTFLATGQTFYVEALGSQPGFTVRCEARRRGAFWYAYRKSGGKLRKRYVGRSQDVTLARLLEVGQALG